LQEEDGGGQAVAILQDITAQKQPDQLWRELLASMSDNFIVFSYPERWRDRPDETWQPVLALYWGHGANSCRVSES